MGSIRNLASRPRRVLAALVVTGTVVLGLSACGGNDLGNVFAVEPGTCFGSVTGDEVRDLPIVDCATEHENEVYAVVQYPGAGAGSDSDSPYPGEAALAEFATAQCQAQLASYVGRSYAQSSLEIAPLYPKEDGWNRVHDRSIVCALFARDGDPLIGSVRNTGR
jgi:hypothetical protein